MSVIEVIAENWSWYLVGMAGFFLTIILDRWSPREVALSLTLSLIWPVYVVVGMFHLLLKIGR